MMRKVHFALWLVTALIAIALMTRAYLLRSHVSAAKSLFDKEIRDGNPEIEPLHFMRGDYHIRLRKPPFRERNWTVNTYTGQMISWESNEKTP